MQEQDLVETASSWCASHGVLMGARDRQSRQPLGHYVYEPAPVSLYPTPFPAHAFEQAYSMAKPFNSVVHKAASSYESWLQPAIATATQGDKDFTGKLVQLANDVMKGPRAQSVALGILRSDYMLHGNFQEAIPLQVELNTIASSFGCLSTKVTQLHQYLNQDDSLPENGAADGIAQGLALALQEYIRQRDTSFPAVVVMVVQPGETNSCDQRDLEFLLLSKFKVHLIRRTLAELAQTGTYKNDKELILPNGTEQVAAGVVYYRAGYTPDDYPTDTEWQGRSLVEHSAAIKCPDVFYHLVGAKKIQQALAEPGVLRQFCESDKEDKLLSSSFAGLYALGEGDDSKAVQAALANPNAYVLKPQREGGGNNLYDDELVQALQSMSYAERGAYILMQKIVSPATDGVLVRRGEIVYRGDCVCELGVFGISLRSYDDGRILHESVAGHILRSKSVQTDEGGVAAGYAFLSSPKLM